MGTSHDVPGAISPPALDAAIQAIERSLRADGADARGVDEGERSGFEWRALKQWCVENGHFLSQEITPERPGGREHDVRFDEAARRWVKFTKWNCAGYSVSLETGEPLFLPATPLEYLRRLRVHNTIFGDRLVLRGIQGEGSALRIVTAQSDIVGEAPSLEEMDRHLRESEGFARLAIPPMGYYKSLSYLRDNVGLFDAHPANCVVTRDGSLVPIDFILLELTPDDHRILAARAEPST
jgi:hypothetical protein